MDRNMIRWGWLAWFALLVGCSPGEARRGTTDVGVDAGVVPVVGAGDYPQPQQYVPPLYVDGGKVFIAGSAVPNCDAGEFVGNGTDAGTPTCRPVAATALSGLVPVASGGTGAAMSCSSANVIQASSGTALACHAMSGDCTINSSGVVTCTQAQGGEVLFGATGTSISMATPNFGTSVLTTTNTGGTTGGSVGITAGSGSSSNGTIPLVVGTGGSGGPGQVTLNAGALGIGEGISCPTGTTNGLCLANGNWSNAPSGGVGLGAASGQLVVHDSSGATSSVTLSGNGGVVFSGAATAPGLSQASTSNATPTAMVDTPQASTAGASANGSTRTIALSNAGASGSPGNFGVTSGGSGLFNVGYLPGTTIPAIWLGQSSLTSGTSILRQNAGFTQINAQSGGAFSFLVNGSYVGISGVNYWELGGTANGTAYGGTNILGIDNGAICTSNPSSETCIASVSGTGMQTRNAVGDFDTFTGYTSGTINSQVLQFGSVVHRCAGRTTGGAADAGTHSFSCSLTTPNSSTCRVDVYSVGRCAVATGGSAGCTLGDSFVQDIIGEGIKTSSGGTVTATFNSGTQPSLLAARNDTSQANASIVASTAANSFIISPHITDVNGGIDWTVSFNNMVCN